MSDASTALALENIHKRFGSIQALTGASLAVRHGTVHALLGENGAGKTTLMKVAYGMESPDDGIVRVRGDVVRLRSPADAIALGVGMVHQHFTLVPAMTVAENLALGGRGPFDSTRASARVRDLTRTTGLAVDPDARVRDLPVTAQQRLELLKVLSRNADILILDEPTAVLAPSEADDLLRRLRQLADSGRAVVLITHKLREALSIADDVTVLRHGATTFATTRGNTDEDALIEAMLGQRDRRNPLAVRSLKPGDPVIVARDVSIVDERGSSRVRGASLEVRSGEIVGIAAVEGSGHCELLRALAGRSPITSGMLTLPRPIGFVPDDRHRDGVILQMSLSENYALKGAGERRGILRWRDVASATREVIREFAIKANSEEDSAGSLSGGNQQKFILGRELHGPPPALVVENPTRGLDVRASSDIQARLMEACFNGVAIVIHSADLDELLAVANRIVVVYAGTVREVPVNAEVVGRAMLGAT